MTVKELFLALEDMPIDATLNVRSWGWYTVDLEEVSFNEEENEVTLIVQ